MVPAAMALTPEVSLLPSAGGGDPRLRLPFDTPPGLVFAEVALALAAESGSGMGRALPLLRPLPGHRAPVEVAVSPLLPDTPAPAHQQADGVRPVGDTPPPLTVERAGDDSIAAPFAWAMQAASPATPLPTTEGGQGPVRSDPGRPVDGSSDAPIQVIAAKGPIRAADPADFAPAASSAVSSADPRRGPAPALPNADPPHGAGRDASKSPPRPHPALVGQLVARPAAAPPAMAAEIFPPTRGNVDGAPPQGRSEPRVQPLPAIVPTAAPLSERRSSGIDQTPAPQAAKPLDEAARTVPAAPGTVTPKAELPRPAAAPATAVPNPPTPSPASPMGRPEDVPLPRQVPPGPVSAPSSEAPRNPASPVPDPEPPKGIAPTADDVSAAAETPRAPGEIRPAAGTPAPLTAGSPTAPSAIDTPPVLVSAARPASDAARQEARPTPLTGPGPEASEPSRPATGPADAAAAPPKAPVGDLPPLIAPEVDPIPHEARTATRHDATPQAQAPVARDVLHQIVAAVRAEPGTGEIEITLSPEELGRVRVSLSVDGPQTAHILADRPETLDLIRRHIDLFTQELRAGGLGAFEFRFGEDRPSQAWHGRADTSESAAPDGSDPPAAIAHGGGPNPLSGGLDLRL